MRARWVLVCAVLVLAGCSSDDDDPARSATSSSTTSSTVADTTSTTAATTSTTAFAGGTDPVTVPLATDHTTLLTGVTVGSDAGVDRVVFELEGAGVPLVEARYVEQVRAAGSGEEVAVDGGAHLEIRMEPASTADLTGEEVRRTYTGPDRVRGDTAAVTEVVRTGDFEANLTWVVGLDRTRPFRISTTRSPARVTVEIDAQPSRS